jgi:predicted molibdopterin-dependent oxidoreductase YjgC
MENPLFYSENLSRNSSALSSISPEPYARIGKALATKLSIIDGDYVNISADAGSIELSARVDSDLPENIVLIPNNFGDKGIFNVMNWKINPVIKSFVLDCTEVVVKKIKSAAEEVLA